MAFTPRLTRPTSGNKYYIRKVNGGYSNAVKGSPTDSQCDVLSNCVGYAYGRFNEIGGYGYCKYLAPTNAENFIQYKGSCEVGQTPKVGACMVWRKGATLNGSDGAGHVAIVVKVAGIALSLSGPRLERKVLMVSGALAPHTRSWVLFTTPLLRTSLLPLPNRPRAHTRSKSSCVIFSLLPAQKLTVSQVLKPCPIR